MKLNIFVVTCLAAGALHAATPAEHGAYLVEVLGCGYCHTPGALIGEPDEGRAFSGSDIGIAYTTYRKPDLPAVVFPGNLTPDEQTGIGTWSDGQVIRFLTSGVDPEGRQHVPVMPWTSYSALEKPDLDAVVAYLRSLPPVRHAVPENVAKGRKSAHRWVRFGVYLFDPHGGVEEYGILDVR